MVGMLAGSLDTVMTGRTTTRHIGRMVKGYDIPCIGRTMTGIALLGGLDMARMHTSSRYTIVAGRT